MEKAIGKNTLFQFHEVQLKEKYPNWYISGIQMFQFHEVQLKAKVPGQTIT